MTVPVDERAVSAEFPTPPIDSPDLSVQIVRTLAGVEELRGVWTTWSGHRDSDIDFILALIKSREEILNPHIIVVYRDGRPDAMLIGRLEYIRNTYRVGYLPIFSQMARRYTFQYGGLRGNPSNENCKMIVLSILSSLKSGEADMAMLDHPPVDSWLYKWALNVPGLLSHGTALQSQPRHLMNLPGTIEEVYLRRSGKHRKRLRSEARKLQSKFDGRLQFCCFREPSELGAAILLVEETAKKTYQRGLGVGFEDTPRMRSLLHLYASKGWLRIYVLIAAGVPIAFWVGAVCEGWFYSDCTGYDPGYREDAPGTYLFMKMIEDFCKEGLRGIDFGLGDAAYKEQFGDHSFEEATIYIFSTRIKGLTLRTFHTVMSVTDGFLRKILAHTKLLMKVKRLWRDRLAQKNAS